MSIYRKIYIDNFGPIPIDENGRTFDIHHRDGNRKNNDPSNLEALSIQDHYDRHYSQKDWAACHKIAGRMKLSPKILSKLATKRNLKWSSEGRNPFSDPELHRREAKKRIDNGTHNFLDKEWQSKEQRRRVSNGSHPFLGNANTDKQIKDGTHPFMKKGFSKAVQNKLLQEGKHHSQIEFSCPNCNKKGRGNGFKRYHFLNCKLLKHRHACNTLPIAALLD